MTTTRTGTVDQLPSGRWRVRVTVDGRRRTLGVYDDETTARRMLRAFLAESTDGIIVAASGVTLRAFGEDWLDRRELMGSRARTRVRNVRNERSLWRRHVEASPLASMAVQSIRIRDVEDFATWLRQRERVDAIHTQDGPLLRPTGEQLAPKTQRNALGLVRLCMEDAVRAELIASNPALKVRVARGGWAADLEDDWLRAGEIDALLGCEDIPIRDRTVYAVAIGLALRLDDLKALRVADVHLDARVPGPHVRIQVSKSQRWHRVPIMPWLVPWLRAHLETLPAGATFVFPNREGRRYGKDFDFGWAGKRERVGTHKDGTPKWRVTPSALERAGVDRRIRFHDLRGTCATHLALGTWGRQWSLHEIQRMLAHTDQRVTERYVRRALDTLADAAAATPGGPSSLVTIGHDAEEPSSASTGNHWVGREGIEPPTVGLKAPSASESSREVRPDRDHGVTTVELARRFLQALEAGEDARGLRDALAAAAIETGEAIIRRGEALRERGTTVQSGGRHSWRWAIELAEELAASGEDDTAADDDAGEAIE